MLAKLTAEFLWSLALVDAAARYWRNASRPQLWLAGVSFALAGRY